MIDEKTALVLIGYQNDYFHKDGALHSVMKKSLKATDVLANTCGLIQDLCATDALLISTPIGFTPNYEELVEPVGILKSIVEAGAFRSGTHGSATIDEFKDWGQRIIEIQGKRGLDAFSNTALEKTLRRHNVRDVLVAGVVTSLCVDSTARHAFELGFRVGVLRDCTSGRTSIEQEFYCDEIFPLYSRVLDAKTVIEEVHARVS
jgi:nicotinamidase-related amidase